jgi:hypothetical protein
MIRLLAFMDIETGLGRTIYTDGTLGISQELVWPMICALNNFVMECTSSERGLVNASLEDIKIYLYSPLGEANPLRFIFFTDLFDNNDYLELRGQRVFEVLSPYISFETFDPPTDILEEVVQISKYTQNLPEGSITLEILDKLRVKLSSLEQQGKLYIADLFIGDIDQGKIFSFSQNEDLQEKNSILLFSELLTAFSIDSEIFVKSTISAKERRRLETLDIFTPLICEGWFLKQLAKRESDFWLVGYFYYNELNEEEVKSVLYELVNEISEEIVTGLSKRPF